MCDWEYGVVTCEYCNNYIIKECLKDYDIFDFSWGLCKKHNVKKCYNNDICEDFVIISGYHTLKWYPNKKTE